MAHSLVPLSPATHAVKLASPSPRSLPQAPPVVLEVPPINRSWTGILSQDRPHIRFDSRFGFVNHDHCKISKQIKYGISLCRTIVLGLGGALWSWNALTAKEEAMAAARRPPPPPPKEKKDPTVSGVQAKVLASRKRKEEMKASIAKLREKGKPVIEAEPSSPSLQ